MKQIFQIYNSICLKYENTDQLIDKLLSFLSAEPKIKTSVDDFLFKALKNNGVLDPISIVQLIGLAHQKKKENNKIAKTDERKHFGIYYTDYEVAKLITSEALSPISNKQELDDKKFLEPCSGIGIFVLSYFDYIFENLPREKTNFYQKIADNIYAADIDAEAINILKKVVPAYVEFKYGIKLELNENNFYIGDLLFKQNDEKILKNDPKEIFKIKEGFDIVITNPPYKLLKANANKYSEDEANNYAINIKKLVEYIKTNKIYKYNEGTLNYYKIFIEEIIENYTHDKSKVGLLIPITLLNDRQSEQLRKRIINNFTLSKIYIIPEKNNFFPDISQAFCFFGIDKSTHSKILEIVTDVKNKDAFEKKSIQINLDTIKEISQSEPVVMENEDGWKILKKINGFSKIKHLSDICNYRGELDLTIDKKFITSQKTKHPLLRGNNIGEFAFDSGGLFVDENFVLKLNGKQKHLKNERLVCQQVSNIHSDKRLKFVRVPENIILGNSCNYLCKTSNLFEENNISLDYLLGILNSLILDWRFKITNSNNHISNYELGDLPIAIPNEEQKINIETLVKKIEVKKEPADVAKLNMEIFKLYQLTKKEIAFILGKYKEEGIINIIKENLNYAI
jgi:Alw26I/Eco31I/Esp3I family type II restriction m6 adenine DNA methyltransferase